MFGPSPNLRVRAFRRACWDDDDPKGRKSGTEKTVK
jgi:hypothetical protein